MPDLVEGCKTERSMPPSGAEAYKKYLAKLDAQETEVDQLRDKIKRLQDDELAQRKAYEDFLAALDVE